MKAPFVKAFVIAAMLSAITIVALSIGVAWILVPAPRERFATRGFSFELARGWACTQEGTEFVCRNGKPPSDSILIMTMKHRSPEDTLSKYEQHLRAGMPMADGNGRAEVISIRRVVIGGADWVEGVFHGSEVPRYDTTYLAGITAEIGILFTMSVHKNFRDIRSKDLKSMAESLVIYQRPDRL